MKEELAEMREDMRHIARDVAPDVPVREAVRDYLYQDGVAIVRLRIPTKRRDPDQDLFDLSQGDWSLFPKGTWFEGSLLFGPEKDSRLPGDTATTRYAGMRQIQTFGTTDPLRLFETLRLIVWPKLEKLGFPRPSEIMIRAGRSVDDSLPFTKKDPPV